MMSSGELEPAFEVVYGCRNCGGSWSDTYPRETQVGTFNGHYQTPHVHCKDRTIEHTTEECEVCEAIECPHCDLRKRVYVEDREPISAEDGGGDD